MPKELKSLTVLQYLIRKEKDSVIKVLYMMEMWNEELKMKSSDRL